jgi:hypothetical protein
VVAREGRAAPWVNCGPHCWSRVGLRPGLNASRPPGGQAGGKPQSLAGVSLRIASATVLP